MDRRQTSTIAVLVMAVVAAVAVAATLVTSAGANTQHATRTGASAGAGSKGSARAGSKGPARSAKKPTKSRPHQPATQALLAMKRGSFEISLGSAPAWLPLSGHSQTLTLIAGAPKLAHAGADNAYIGFVDTSETCAVNPAASHNTFWMLKRYYSAAHLASKHPGNFAPNKGAARGTYIDSVGHVTVGQSNRVKACIWIAPNQGIAPLPKPKGKHKHKLKQPKIPKTLRGSLVIPLLNNTFAASVSNLTGATPGAGGYTLYAIDGGRGFRYSAVHSQCNRTSRDGAQSVGAGTPASESVSIAAAPCSGDTTTFSFSGAAHGTLAYPVADALASPAVSVAKGGCELDPLTGVALASAEQYLTAVGCELGKLEVTPFQKTLPRGAVSWASVDGGVAELAPHGTKVDLVLNGTPS